MNLLCWEQTQAESLLAEPEQHFVLPEPLILLSPRPPAETHIPGVSVHDLLPSQGPSLTRHHSSQTLHGSTTGRFYCLQVKTDYQICRTKNKPGGERGGGGMGISHPSRVISVHCQHVTWASIIQKVLKGAFVSPCSALTELSGTGTGCPSRCSSWALFDSRVEPNQIHVNRCRAGGHEESW